MRKIILEVEYCMKYDLLNVKIFQKNRLISSRDEDLYFALKLKKIQVY